MAASPQQNDSFQILCGRKTTSNSNLRQLAGFEDLRHVAVCWSCCIGPGAKRNKRSTQSRALNRLNKNPTACQASTSTSSSIDTCLGRSSSGSFQECIPAKQNGRHGRGVVRGESKVNLFGTRWKGGARGTAASCTKGVGILCRLGRRSPETGKAWRSCRHLSQAGVMQLTQAALRRSCTDKMLPLKY